VWGSRYSSAECVAARGLVLPPPDPAATAESNGAQPNDRQYRQRNGGWFGNRTRSEIQESDESSNVVEIMIAGTIAEINLVEGYL